MTPYVLMSRLEGLLGTGLRADRAPQNVSIWVKVMREIIFSTDLRNATDFELGADQDVIATGANGEIDASGGTVYGLLIDSIFDVAGEHLDQFGKAFHESVSAAELIEMIDRNDDPNPIGRGTGGVPTKPKVVYL